jgi:hypothetical protein
MLFHAFRATGHERRAPALPPDNRPLIPAFCLIPYAPVVLFSLPCCRQAIPRTVRYSPQNHRKRHLSNAEYCRLAPLIPPPSTHLLIHSSTCVLFHAFRPTGLPATSLVRRRRIWRATSYVPRACPPCRLAAPGSPPSPLVSNYSLCHAAARLYLAL